MRKIFCDLCGREIKEENKEVLQIGIAYKNGQSEPFMQGKEICVWCGKKIENFLGELQK